MTGKEPKLTLTEQRVIKVLSWSACGLTAAALATNCSLLDLSATTVQQILKKLAEQGLASRGLDGSTGWSITAAGRLALDGAKLPKPEAPAKDAVTAAICHRPETPAIATCCLDEDELDAWWKEQDVEVKADVFLAFHLGGSSHIDANDQVVTIPILGMIGDATCADECRAHQRPAAQDGPDGVPA